jgi:hypothetical protein
MVSNNEAANALVKLKTSKKPKTKPGPKPKPRPNSALSAKELNNKYRVETDIVGSRSKTPSANKSNSMNKITTALIANRSNKPKNNNKKKAARNFLQSLFTPRKNVKK